MMIAGDRLIIVFLKKWLFAFLIIFVLFILASALQESFSYEEGIYGDFTLSIIKDKDFNLINQENRPQFNWLATVNGQLPTFEYPAISAYLAPFYLYQTSILHPLSSDFKVNRGYDFIYVHILATLFYFILGVVAYFQVSRRLGLKSALESLLFVCFGTGFLYYFIFCSTTTDIFTMSYSILVLLYYLEIKQSCRPHQAFIFGLAASLGYCLRIELCWIAVLVLKMLLRDLKNHKLLFLWVAIGALFPLAGFYSYRIIEASSFTVPLLVYFSGYLDSLRFAPLGFWYILFGPNGYLVSFPIFALIALSIFTSSLRRKANRDFSWIVYLFPFLLMLMSAALPIVMDDIQGRHLLTYLFLFMLNLAELLDLVRLRSRREFRFLISTLIVFCLWSIYVQVCYLFASSSDYPKWLYEYQLQWDRFLLGGALIEKHLLNIKLFKNSVELLLFVPLVAILATLLVWIWNSREQLSKRVLPIFFISGSVVWVCFCTLNLYFNQRNVDIYRSSGIYKNKVIGKSIELEVYDDKIEVYRVAVLHYLLYGRCDLAKKLDKIFDDYISRITSAVVSDPLGFREQLEHRELRRSPLESDWVLKRLKDERASCPKD